MPNRSKNHVFGLSAIPATAQVDLCTMAILRAAEALGTPEGREAIERGKKEYLRHLAKRERSDAGQINYVNTEGG